jgi:hypothetical protein
LFHSFLFFLGLAGVIALLLAISLFFLLPKLMKNFSGRGGGWLGLAEHFPALSQPAGEYIKGQTVEVGQVVYKRCAMVGITEHGLYLEVNTLFSSRLNPKPLFIPWEMVKGLKEGNLYWKKTRILSIGEPETGTISFFSGLFALLRPHLKHLL